LFYISRVLSKVENNNSNNTEETNSFSIPSDIFLGNEINNKQTKNNEQFRTMLEAIEKNRNSENNNNNNNNQSQSFLSNKIEREMNQVRLQSLEQEIENLQSVLLKEKHQNYLLSTELDRLLQVNQQLQQEKGETTLEGELEEKESSSAVVPPPFTAPTRRRNEKQVLSSDLLHSVDNLLKELNRDVVFPAPMAESLQNNENFKYLKKKYTMIKDRSRIETERFLLFLQQYEKEQQGREGPKQLKETIQKLSRELAQKKELVQSLQESKKSDQNTLELFKNEIRSLEEKLTRLQTTLQIREQTIKDSRNKNELLQQQLINQFAAPPNSTEHNSSLYKMTQAEMIAR
jgi:DNA repair exonuclease SbcCD ATPase subunit